MQLAEESLRVGTVREVADAVEDDEPAVRQRLVDQVAVLDGDHGVVAAPDDEERDRIR